MSGLKFDNDGISGQNLVNHINHKVVPGVYIGNGQKERYIDLGFAPDWVFVSCTKGERTTTQDYTDMPAMTGMSTKDKDGNVYGRIVKISGTGFTVYCDNQTSLVSDDLYTNYNGFTYMFIAGVGDFIKIEN